MRPVDVEVREELVEVSGEGADAGAVVGAAGYPVVAHVVGDDALVGGQLREQPVVHGLGL
ncbi:hypothetical protein N7U49_30280 [Streptomyces sp. AD2-2]|nr:hypothetical protein N7U49_30280 [Streptomyces sp. AD2-2]